MSEMKITSWLHVMSWREQVQPLLPSPIIPLVAVLISGFRNVALREMKKTLLFRGDGLMSESKSELHPPTMKEGRLVSES